MRNKHPWLWTAVFVVVLALWLASDTGLAVERRLAITPIGKTLDGWTPNGNPEGSHWMIGIAKLEPDNPRELAVEPLKCRICASFFSISALLERRWPEALLSESPK